MRSADYCAWLNYTQLIMVLEPASVDHYVCPYDPRYILYDIMTLRPYANYDLVSWGRRARGKLISQISPSVATFIGTLHRIGGGSMADLLSWPWPEPCEQGHAVARGAVVALDGGAQVEA